MKIDEQELDFLSHWSAKMNYIKHHNLSDTPDNKILFETLLGTYNVNSFSKIAYTHGFEQDRLSAFLFYVNLPKTIKKCLVHIMDYSTKKVENQYLVICDKTK